MNSKESPIFLHEDLTSRIIAASYRVHNSLGPGFLEHVYGNALVRVLRSEGLRVRPNSQSWVYFEKDPDPVGWCWSDMVVEDLVVVELKATELIKPGHRSQILAYMRTSGHKVGLIINFGPLKVDVKREEWSGEVRKSG